MNKDNYTMLVIKDSYKEFIYKIIKEGQGFYNGGQDIHTNAGRI